jgi:hypothetical protein
MTFGQGVPDAETLPQAFADATGYRLHVLNLASLATGRSNSGGRSKPTCSGTC